MTTAAVLTLLFLSDIFGVWGCSNASDIVKDDNLPATEPLLRVIGYFPDYKIAQVDDSVALKLTDVIYFSIEPRADGGLDLTRLGIEARGKLNSMRSKNPKLRVHIAFGGWGRSGNFAQMATDSVARRNFIQSARSLCLAQNFAGVDYDWEFPANAVENKAYADLLVETGSVFHQSDLQVSVALNVNQHLDTAAYSAVDRIHIMSYDHSGRHSTYEQALSDVTNFRSRGIAADILCLGVPFYGRGITNREQTVSYGQIVADYYPAAEVDEIDGIYFNGRGTIARKTNLALDTGLRGIMIWEIGQDAPGLFSLLMTINEEIDAAMP